MIKPIPVVISLFLFSILSSSYTQANPSVEEVSYSSSDKTNINAYWIPTSHSKTSPTIVLFHQAGASARGEYQDIYPKLVESGFSVLMVDLRSGGKRFGGINKTVEQLNNKKFSYCDAYPDMQASLNWLKTKGLSGPVIVWGSSYSAGLVFKLAAENKNEVDGVLGFSPASGKPMQGCRPDEHLKEITVPAIAFRPDTEMEYDSVKVQAELFKGEGIPYVAIKNGVHGSSMLVEKRTKHNMQHAWQKVDNFLAQFKALPSAKNTESVSLVVNGWELKADLQLVSSKQKLPAVLLLHKAAGTKDEYIDMSMELAKLGIASLRIDLRGHGLSTNKGSFEEPYRDNRSLLNGTEADVIAAYNWLKQHPAIDPKRIAVVGASYSGERMAIAARSNEYAKAYIALSPGDFSDESIIDIDKNGKPWLFVRAKIERDFFDDLYQGISDLSHTAEIWVIPGKSHATRLLTHDKSLAGRLSLWINKHL